MSRRRLCLLLFCTLGGGCAMPGGPSASSPSSDAAASRSDLVPAAGRAVLVVSRERHGRAEACAHLVSIDGRPVAELRPGGWVTAYPRPGEHAVAVSSTGAGCAGRSEVVVVLTEGREHALRTSVGSDGQLAIVATTR